MYKASIIIPVYNAEKMLRKCVESLVFGAEKDIEVILSEDCSKDGSWKVSCELANEFENVVAIRNEKNSGVSYTRNQGLNIAKGKYILFVDSDDWVSGNYAKRLIEVADQYTDSLSVCGFRFHENVAGYQRDYLWDDCGDGTRVVSKQNYFGLVSKVLMQSPCNKAFRRDIIEKYNIRFDVTQSMGEDFQFVLDYLENGIIEQCIVINEPLYHYIRWGNSSLMSNFGIVANENDKRRLEQLYKICGDSEVAKKDYFNALESSKNNQIYHVIRSEKLSKEQKIAFIEKIIGKEEAERIYKQQERIIFKEKLAVKVNKIKIMPNRIKGRIQREKNIRLINKIKRGFVNKDISIISQNCIGGVFYHDMGLKFLSPTINLYFSAKDFVKFVSNLPYYLNLDIEMEMGEKFPIGKLEDITVNFMHYESCTEAKESWNKRKQRVNYERVFVLSTDRVGFDAPVFEEWKKIKYPKLLFTVNKEFSNEPDSVYYPEHVEEGQVPDLIPTREFYKSNALIDALNRM